MNSNCNAMENTAKSAFHADASLNQKLQLSFHKFYYVFNMLIPNLTLAKETKLAKSFSRHQRCADENCFYNQILCSACHSCIGRYYISTTPKMHALNAKYCLMKTRVAKCEFSPFSNKYIHRVSDHHSFQSPYSKKNKPPRKQLNFDENYQLAQSGIFARNYKSAKLSPDKKHLLGGSMKHIPLSVTQPLRERDLRPNFSPDDHLHKYRDSHSLVKYDKYDRLEKCDKYEKQIKKRPSSKLWNKTHHRRTKKVDKLLERMEKIEATRQQNHAENQKKLETFQDGVTELLNWVVVINRRLDEMDTKMSTVLESVHKIQKSEFS